MFKKVLFMASLAVALVGSAGTAMADPGDHGKAIGVRGRECARPFGYNTVGEGLQFRRQMKGNNAGGVPAALVEFMCPGTT